MLNPFISTHFLCGYSCTLPPLTLGIWCSTLSTAGSPPLCSTSARSTLPPASCHSHTLLLPPGGPCMNGIATINIALTTITVVLMVSRFILLSIYSQPWSVYSTHLLKSRISLISAKRILASSTLIGSSCIRTFRGSLYPCKWHTMHWGSSLKPTE